MALTPRQRGLQFVLSSRGGRQKSWCRVRCDVEQGGLRGERLRARRGTSYGEADGSAAAAADALLEICP